MTLGPADPRARLLPPATHLVDSAGAFALGMRTQPFERVNPLDAKLRGPLGLRRSLKKLALKEWQHFALVNRRFYISVALFDAKRLALAQIIVFDRQRRTLHEYERRILPHKLSLPDALLRGRASFADDEFEITVTNHLGAAGEGASQGHTIALRAPAGGGRPALRGEFTIDEPLDRVEPMVVALPFDGGRAMYSHKAVLRCRGQLQIGQAHERFEPEQSYSLVDIHKGYYPFVMTWHWATGARVDGEHIVGFNLTDNQVADQARFNENGLWVDGRLHPLGPVRFEFDARDPMRAWKIRDREGRVDIDFFPQALRKVDINLLVMKSRYRGPFGAFEGRIRDGEGNDHRVDGAFGMCEDFYLRA